VRRSSKPQATSFKFTQENATLKLVAWWPGELPEAAEAPLGEYTFVHTPQ
jgi:hypothetical protein